MKSIRYRAFSLGSGVIIYVDWISKQIISKCYKSFAKLYLKKNMFNRTDFIQFAFQSKMLRVICETCARHRVSVCMEIKGFSHIRNTYLHSMRTFVYGARGLFTHALCVILYFCMLSRGLLVRSCDEYVQTKSTYSKCMAYSITNLNTNSVDLKYLIILDKR